VGSEAPGGVQVGFAARASDVRQTPPPAAPTHTRQEVAEQAGSTAIAVTRPEFVVGVPTSVFGS